MQKQINIDTDTVVDKQIGKQNILEPLFPLSLIPSSSVYLLTHPFLIFNRSRCFGIPTPSRYEMCCKASVNRWVCCTDKFKRVWSSSFFFSHFFSFFYRFLYFFDEVVYNIGYFVVLMIPCFGYYFFDWFSFGSMIITRNQSIDDL